MLHPDATHAHWACENCTSWRKPGDDENHFKSLEEAENFLKEFDQEKKEKKSKKHKKDKDKDKDKPKKDKREPKAKHKHS